jgi:hypothetical protein
LETKKQKLIPAFFFLFFFVNFRHVVTRTKGLQLIERVFLVKKKQKKAHQKLQNFEGGKKKMVRFRPKVRAFCRNISGFQNIYTFLSNL